MKFKNLKVTITKVEGNCSRSKVGTTSNIKNAKLEIPPDQNICIFALGSILQPITTVLIQSKEGEGMLGLLQEWHFLDPLQKSYLRLKS